MASIRCGIGPTTADAVLWEAFESAKERIDASVYAPTSTLVEACNQAAARGIQIRLTMDPAVDSNARQRALTLCGGGVQCRLLSLPDHDAHAKLVVIDEQDVLVGSGSPAGVISAAGAGGNGLGEGEWLVLVRGATTLNRLARTHVARNWATAAPPLGIARQPDRLVDLLPSTRAIAEVFEVELSPRRLRLGFGGARRSSATRTGYSRDGYGGGSGGCSASRSPNRSRAP